VKKLHSWITAAIIIVIFFGTIYVVVQQSQRRDANYPQIQLAGDTAATLNSTNNPSAIVSGRVDMNSSLAPFTIIYNYSGQIVAGNGYLNGHIPSVPLGVLQAAKNKTYSAVTWQPQNSVREAAVTVAAHNYYIVSGRSLTEVEKNETATLSLSLLGCFLALAVLCGDYYFESRIK
jgi:hypothetical protein